MSDNSSKAAIITAAATILAAVISVIGVVYFQQKSSDNNQPVNTTSSFTTNTREGSGSNHGKESETPPKSKNITFSVAMDIAVAGAQDEIDTGGEIQVTVSIDGERQGTVYANQSPRSIRISVPSSGVYNYELRGVASADGQSDVELYGSDIIHVTDGAIFRIGVKEDNSLHLETAVIRN